jgi:REP element-mobilizing transposase RayT
MEARTRQHMAHTYTKAHFHVVFSTRSRQKLIPTSVQPRLWAYMAGICSNVGMFALAIGGIEDHVHSLVELPPTMSLSKAVNLLKSNSSGWMNDRRRDFHSQEGYGAFAVSVSNLPAVKRYVLNQEARHCKMTFENEYIALLKKHGVQYDSRYVFD